jgi:hypothetical protein
VSSSVGGGVVRDTTVWRGLLALQLSPGFSPYLIGNTYVSATEPNRLMLFRGTVAAYCENHTVHSVGEMRNFSILKQMALSAERCDERKDRRLPPRGGSQPMTQAIDRRAGQRPRARRHSTKAKANRWHCLSMWERSRARVSLRRRAEWFQSSLPSAMSRVQQRPLNRRRTAAPVDCAVALHASCHAHRCTAASICPPFSVTALYRSIRMWAQGR